jgi:hypothetical protein
MSAKTVATSAGVPGPKAPVARGLSLRWRLQLQQSISGNTETPWRRRASGPWSWPAAWMSDEGGPGVEQLLIDYRGCVLKVGKRDVGIAVGKSGTSTLELSTAA